MKKILIIGSGWEQLALIQTIKAAGHYLIMTHPSLLADGFNFADQFYVKDSRDIASHLRIAETHKIDAVITDNCDYSFFTASVIASKLQLPFADLQSGIFSNDKFSQRQRCKKHSILQPDFRKVQTIDELNVAAIELGFPLILKPIDSRGTFGVTITQNLQELENAYYDAIHNSPSRILICEKFISGTLVTVDGFCFKNGHRSLAVASRKFENGSKPVTKEIIYPAQFSENLKIKLMRNHEMVVAALGYNYGHSHGEYLVTENGEIYLVECSNRGGGVYTSSVIVPLLTEINLNEILMNQSLGIDNYLLNQTDSNYMKKSIILTFLDFEVGKVIKSINIEEMLDLPYTVKFRSIYSVHDMVESVENCASRHSMLVVQGKNSEEAISNFDLFKKLLKIEYYN
ncbi:ATP-grasp domain-containing protein [Leptospira kanakyensis]|uniref:ATP-grasp domain-containing protein n=1 Tax=Leptospira kanakyensis TaxID=2484968 RepID=UPI00223E641C|nr:ATP-grasp domain-containing protein [Leptospira kanakyensis]MCW7482141.1 ATP-grasp domain-containing protein [Leptospira kanakyensis]